MTSIYNEDVTLTPPSLAKTARSGPPSGLIYGKYFGIYLLDAAPGHPPKSWLLRFER
jgi:hypothetical protein